MGQKRRPKSSNVKHELYQVAPGEDFTELFVVATSAKDAVAVYCNHCSAEDAARIWVLWAAIKVDIECLGVVAEISADLHVR